MDASEVIGLIRAAQDAHERKACGEVDAILLTIARRAEAELRGEPPPSSTYPAIGIEVPPAPASSSTPEPHFGQAGQPGPSADRPTPYEARPGQFEQGYNPRE